MWKQFFHIGFTKTLWFNIRYLPFIDAIHIPVLLSRDVQIRYCNRGFCEFMGGAKMGLLRFGFGDRLYSRDQKSSLFIAGKMIVVGRGVHAFGVGTQLTIHEKGVLQVGNNFTSSINNKIVCRHSITIGDDNMWSFDNVVMDTDAHQILSIEGEVINKNRSVTFGNHVWLGCRNIVLKGASIPDGCIIASGSKISGSYERVNSIITSKGKTIKENIIWKRDTALI